MTPPPAGTSSEGRLRFADLAEETTGFGELEYRTFRDLLVRPRDVLIAYLERGPTAGGRYARPFGFYLALCGVLMFYMFLMGGLKGIIEQQPAETLERWIKASGKSRELFIDDADGWMGLVAVPLMSVFYVAFGAPLIRWWSGLDWRRSMRATLVLLCAWTVPILFLGPLPMMDSLKLIASLVMYVALIVAFLRTGRGIWFDRWPGGLGKGLLFLFAILVSSWVSMIPVFNIGLLGALYGH
ncbi:hypothetical protein [Sphingomonas sp. LHG3406-1]|uniref:hypothetical protein n=1 Tax=Sphingomonas sp. LHG3406-1 TaxID=2804617 RepID=UPI00261218F5|nr:hypothetical protein [Sphingomonas sp. LHG3406-1]